MTEHRFHTLGIFFDPEDRQVLLQLRDGKTDICPHQWALFGGLSEPGEEPVECFLREIHEELGVDLRPEEARLVRVSSHHRTGQPAHLFVVARYIAPRDLRLTEGAGFGWFPVDQVGTLALADGTGDALGYLGELMQNDARLVDPELGQ